MNKKQPLKHILIIDDDPIANMLSTMVVSRNPDTVVSTCSSGQQALDLFRPGKNSNCGKIPDIILLDINMPLMNGWEFLDKFDLLPGNCTKNCRVVMLSSSLDPGDIEKCKMFHLVECFVSKPLTKEKVQNLFCKTRNSSAGDLESSIELNTHRV